MTAWTSLASRRQPREATKRAIRAKGLTGGSAVPRRRLIAALTIVFPAVPLSGAEALESGLMLGAK